MVLGISSVFPATWSRLDGCRLVENDENDGDSFVVEQAGRRYTVRLYFVDCVESNPSSRQTAQAAEFGIRENPDVRGEMLAAQATEFTRQKLDRSFVVHTRRDGGTAVRAYVETADGEDLGTLLVREGLALVRENDGMASSHPDGRSTAQVARDLRLEETAAHVARAGGWNNENPSTNEADPNTVFPVEDLDALIASAGKRVRVSGRVGEIKVLPDGRLTFVNFDGQSALTAFIRDDRLDEVLGHSPENRPQALAGQTIVLEGVVTLYRNHPQIEIESPGQIHIVQDPQEPWP